MGSSTFLVFFSVLLSLATLTLSQDVFHVCDDTRGKYTVNSTYKANLDSLVSKFSSLTNFNYGFFNLSAGKSPDDVHSTSLCRPDQNLAQCISCLNNTAAMLEQSCPSNKEAIAWSEFCSVRYTNRDMYGQLEPIPPRTCAYNTVNASNPVQFNQTLSDLLDNLSSKAAAGGPLLKYAAGNATAGNSQKVYAMVQCTPDMDQSNCSKCLNFAVEELEKCCYGKIGCRVLRTTCVLRFETGPFFNESAVSLPSTPPSPSPATPPTSGGVSPPSSSPSPSPATLPPSSDVSPPSSSPSPSPATLPPSSDVSPPSPPPSPESSPTPGGDSPESPPPSAETPPPSSGAPPPSQPSSPPTSPPPASQPPSPPTSPPPATNGGNGDNTARALIFVIASVVGLLILF
ncbi:hypothetical protein PTKIN_Ptkin18bG0137200 [Pterospermum kingtungense]